MSETEPSPILLNRSFDDFDELAMEVKNWDLDLRQLDGGRFEGELFQAVVGKMLFTEARFGRTLQQEGAAPPGLRTIAIPAGPDVQFDWRKTTISGSDMLIFPRHGDWGSFSQPNFHVFILSLPECLLEEAMVAAGLDKVSELLEAEAVSCAPMKIASLRETLSSLTIHAREDESILIDPRILDALQDDLPKLFANAILKSSSRPTGGTRCQRRLVFERAERFISENADEPLTVQDICEAVKVSKRTIQFAFMEHVHVTPKAYLKAVRLNGVRRELKNAQLGAAIHQVAMRWGFWHMSQLAADYRKHFGELPSETVRRVASEL